MSEYITINTAPEKVKKVLPLPVYGENHPALSMKPTEVDVAKIATHEFQHMIEQLKLTMKTFNGLGLSATQCNINEPVFVLGSDVFQMVCINPKIIETLGEPVRKKEGCLSFPGMYLTVPRYESIRVEFFNQQGEKIVTLLEGITAQVYQHELDHLNGVCYTQRVGPLAVKMAKQKQAKLIKKVSRLNK